MKLPSELMDKIFMEGESNPRNVRSFGKFMSTKTKQKNLVCKKVIDTGDLKKVRLLKFHNTKCTRDDLMYALDKGLIDIAKYINSAYPESQILYTDILINIVNNNVNMVDKLLDIYKFSNMEEYYNIFGIITDNQKQLMKIILDKRPYKHKALILSEVFRDQLNFLALELNDYFKNFMSVAKNIIIDDNFIAKLLLSHQFRNLELLFNNYYSKKLDRQIIEELSLYSIYDFEISDFMNKHKYIF